MKVNYSLSLKLTLIVVLSSIAIIFALSYFNLQQQGENEGTIVDIFSEDAVINFAKSHSVIGAIDQITKDYEMLNNTENLSSYISDFAKNNSKILKININKPTEDGLAVYVSTDNSSIGDVASNLDFNNNSYANGDTYYIVDENNPILTIISPINISGDIVGTYDIVLSFSPPSVSHEEQIKLIIIVAFVSILVLIFSLIYLLRRIIVKPIITFRNSAKIIGKGNLDTRVKIISKDELGDLANAFNQMAKDLKESRDKVQDYNQILENLLQQKDEFIGQLGHDLKNPLQPLIGLLPMLIEQEKDPKTKEALQLMNKNAEYMRDLILKTLQLAKLRSSNIKFDFEKLNLLEIAGSVVDAQKLLLNERKMEVENKIGNDIFVEADKLRLAEVFTNLITNSVKYTPESGGKITLDAKKDDGVVTVSIKDTGIGMTETQLKRVFDEFYKADIKTAEYDSTGLGLSICKRIIDKHEGKIWAESPGPRMGSTFYFTLKSMDEK